MVTIFILMILSFIQSNKIEKLQTSIDASKQAIKASNAQFNEFIKGGF